MLWSIPKCLYANSVATLPLLVLLIKPSCNKNGSTTSSIVEISSPIAVDIVSTPTGPPLNLLISASKYSISILSKP